ncbi:MAG: hypothetical protein ACR2QF_10855, partial [Geminicoccaceae bacterium]
ISAENTFTAAISPAMKDRVQIICAGDGAEGFGTTVVTIQIKAAQWPDTQWVPVGTITTADADGQAQFIELGSNVLIRAGVVTGDFDSNVSIFLAA